MKRLGMKKTRTHVEGHQDCGICHPHIKGNRSTEKTIVVREIASETPAGLCSIAGCGLVIFSADLCMNHADEEFGYYD